MTHSPSSQWRHCLLAVLVTLMMTACTHPAARHGRSFERAGKLPEANMVYLRTLEREGEAAPRRIHHRAELTGLAVLQERLTRAALALEGDRPEEALDHAWRAARLDGRLRAAGVDTGLTEEVDRALSEASQATCTHHLDLARAAAAESRWATALGHLDAAEATEGCPAEVELRVSLLLGWAEADRTAGRLRGSAERLRTAHVARPDAELGKRAAAAWRQLGTAALDQGACRRATADLTVADGLSRGADESLLRRARTCATTVASVTTLSNANTQGLANRLGPTLVADGMQGATPFLRLSADPVRPTKDLPRMLPSPSGPRPSGPYEVVLQVDLVQFQAGLPERRQRRMATTQRYPCAALGGCVRDVMVTFDEYTMPLGAVLSGTLKVVDRAQGDVLLAMPWRNVQRDGATWAGNGVVVETSTWHSLGPIGSGLAWPSGHNPFRLTTSAKARAETEERLKTALVEGAARDLSLRLLQILDTEPGVADAEPAAAP